MDAAPVGLELLAAHPLFAAKDEGDADHGGSLREMARAA
jgi:hypothetical protein